MQPTQIITPSPQSDGERLFTLFDALGMAQVSDSLWMITIPGPPSSKGVDGRKTKVSMQALGRTAKYLSEVITEKLTGNVGMACIFYRQNRQRIDTDNLIKHVCDAATGAIWNDDSQCTAVAGITELDPENPRTVIMIGEHESTLTRGTDAKYPCKVCGADIMMEGQYGKWAATCSVECSNALKGYKSLEKKVPCAHCGEGYRRKTKTQKFCSEACRDGGLRDRRRANARPFSKCMDCNKQLSHKRGGRCRECWKENLAGKRDA